MLILPMKVQCSIDLSYIMYYCIGAALLICTAPTYTEIAGLSQALYPTPLNCIAFWCTALHCTELHWTTLCSTSSSVIPSAVHYSTVLCSATQWRSVSLHRQCALVCCSAVQMLSGLHFIPKNINCLNLYALTNTTLLCHPLKCTSLQCTIIGF